MDQMLQLDLSNTLLSVLVSNKFPFILKYSSLSNISTQKINHP